MFEVECNRLWRGTSAALIALSLFASAPAWASSEAPPLIGGIVRRHLAAPPVMTPVDGPMCQSVDPDLPDPDPILPDLMGVLLEATPSETEQRFVDRALTACEGIRGPVRLAADPFQVLALARLEENLGVPESARGILVAAWCVETSMRARPGKGKQFLGDFHEGVARASGSFQLHENVWATTCGGTRNAPHDLLWAAGCWWSQVLKTEEKARRVSGCEDADMLRVAEAAASNVRRYGWRCDSKSAHWQVLEMIQDLPKAAAR